MRFPAALALPVLLSIASSVGCQAQAPAAPPPDGAASREALFARYDVTEDGWLSGTELDACACRHADADGDGEVTRNEFLGGQAPASPAAAAALGTPAATCASAGTARLQLAKTRFAPNEPMHIGFAHPQPGYMDNIELHRLLPGRSEMVRGSFVWGQAEGTVALPAPGAPGRYEVRYVAADGGEPLACAAFEVDPARDEAPPTATATLPEGVYATYFHGYGGLLNKWLAGDIEILPGGRYTFQGEAGRYGYDPASGRLVWTGGGLDGVYTVVRESGGRPALVLPRKENVAAGRELAVSDVWAYLE